MQQIYLFSDEQIDPIFISQLNATSVSKGVFPSFWENISSGRHAPVGKYCELVLLILEQSKTKLCPNVRMGRDSAIKRGEKNLSTETVLVFETYLKATTQVHRCLFDRLRLV